VPVGPNQSDAATLQQIPGVTAELAQSLIAAPPYASNDAFLTKLGASLSADRVAAAKAYLQ
jgi:radical SAM superfamily enzyme with C-terminal helix-hairpin-helix motif